MGDIVLGLVGADYVLLAADCSVARSIVRYQDTEDKVCWGGARPSWLHAGA